MSSKTTVVKTVVPAEQKIQWVQQAEQLEMSQSEFVRTMVQAGRRDFDLEPPETSSPDANPRGNGLEDCILKVLSTETSLEFDEIVDELISEIDVILGSLRDAGRIEFSNLHGYTITEGEHGDD